MILLIIPILFICLFIIIPGLYHFFKKEKEDIVTVENKLDLFNLHTNKEVWKGLVVLVKDTNTKYILTSIDFDNNDPWELWKQYSDIKSPKYSLEISDKLRNTRFIDSNGEETKYDLVVAKGNSFKHRKILNGDVLGIDRACFPKINGMVLDENLTLWEVKDIKNTSGVNIYELVRSDQRHRFAKDINIYGVVRSAWTVGLDI